MRICLVDDDSSQLDYLKVLIEKWANNKNVSMDINYYHSAEEMLFETSESYPFDLIVLDIQMGKMNGIELAQKIRETDKNIVIAFVSGMADYVFDGYEVQALRYILKPIKDDKVYELLDYVDANKQEMDKYIILSVLGEKKKVNHEDILYLESMGHYVVVHLKDTKYDYKYNISDLYQELAGSIFIKTHRSYIVNLKYVEKITRSECHLINQIKIPLSRSSYKAVNQKFIDFYRGKGA